MEAGEVKHGYCDRCKKYGELRRTEGFEITYRLLVVPDRSNSNYHNPVYNPIREVTVGKPVKVDDHICQSCEERYQRAESDAIMSWIMKVCPPAAEQIVNSKNDRSNSKNFRLNERAD